MREKTVEWALKEKIIAIVRGMEAKDCLRVAQALYDGGIRLMEITYDQRDPAQWAKTADAIGKIAEAFEGRMLVGAGTVTTPELVTRTRDAGGQFIISPDTNPAVIAVGNSCGARRGRGPCQALPRRSAWPGISQGRAQPHQPCAHHGRGRHQ